MMVRYEEHLLYCINCMHAQTLQCSTTASTCQVPELVHVSLAQQCSWQQMDQGNRDTRIPVTVFDHLVA